MDMHLAASDSSEWWACNTVIYAAIMPRGHQLVGRLTARYISGTRVPCHALATGNCTCAVCSPTSLNDSSRSYHVASHAAVGVSSNGGACTGSRSCGCSGCRADTSGARSSLSPTASECSKKVKVPAA